MSSSISPNYEAALRKLAQGLVSQARPDLDPAAAEHVRWTARLVEAALADVAPTTDVGAGSRPIAEGATAHEAGSFASLRPDPDWRQAICACGFEYPGWYDANEFEMVRNEQDKCPGCGGPGLTLQVRPLLAAPVGGTDGIALKEAKPPQTWGLGVAKGPRSAGRIGPEPPAEGGDRGNPQPPPARG